MILITTIITLGWIQSTTSVMKENSGMIHNGKPCHHVFAHSLRISLNLFQLHNMRQNFLVEDLLEHFDDGTLCGASMILDPGAECSCLLQDLHHVETSIPVPLKHILPQKFTTPLLVQTMRKIDQLPLSTEASVRESTDSRIIELIPGLQDIRQKTLPQMYFEDCSVLRRTYGRVSSLFQHPEDAVMIIWKPGGYDHVYFMFMSQLYPHHDEQFKIHDWNMIVFSREATGAIKRRVPDSPAQGNVPPDGDDPIHPDQHGGDLLPEDVPIEDDSNDPLDDDNQPDYNTGPDPDDEDDQEYIIPHDHGPPPDDDLDMPGIQDSGETPEPDCLQHHYLILTFQLNRLLILDQTMILHQDLIKLLNQEFKGNRDRFLLIQLMLYQRQRPR